MPELPEVETVRRTLAPAIGARVEAVWYSGLPLHTSRPVDIAAVRRATVGAELAAVRRWGKFLLLDFAGRAGVVIVHLGMSGRLRIVDAAEPLAPHTHVVWSLGQTRALRFSDPRRFGIVSLTARGREREHPSLARLGADPLDGIDPAALRALTRASSAPIKVFLLDQRRLAGVGNIYASEALWSARIRPCRRAERLSTAQVAALARAVPDVLHRALTRGGTSLRDFVSADGTPGDYRGYLRVYDRAGEPCPRRGCAGVIARSVIQGRATFSCPSCQS